MNLRFRRTDPDLWPLGTWQPRAGDERLVVRHTVLVVGSGSLATRVARHCADSEVVLLAGRALDAAAATAAIEVARPDYALVCGGVDAGMIGHMVAELHRLPDCPATRVVIVGALAGRMRYLPLAELVPSETRTLETLVGVLAPAF